MPWTNPSFPRMSASQHPVRNMQEILGESFCIMICCQGVEGSPMIVGRYKPSPPLIEGLRPVTEGTLQGREKQCKHKLFRPDFPRTFLILTPDAHWSKIVSPPPVPQANKLLGADVHDFLCGCPWPEGCQKTTLYKEFALVLWPIVLSRRWVFPRAIQGISRSRSLWIIVP